MTSKLPSVVLNLVLCIPQAFAIFCGLGIHNTMIYDQMAKAKAKQQVAIEVTYKATWGVAKGRLPG